MASVSSQPPFCSLEVPRLFQSGLKPTEMQLRRALMRSSGQTNLDGLDLKRVDASQNRVDATQNRVDASQNRVDAAQNCVNKNHGRNS